MEKARLVFVDLLRGWAVLVMIETHVFNAMMMQHLRDTAWFDVVNFINGLVAPSFLFVSGFVFVLSARRKIGEFRAFGPALWKQLGRIAVIWIVAYGLHLPYFSFRKMSGGVSTEAWLKFYQADILHCIVVGWLFLLLMSMVIRSELVVRRLVLGSSGMFVLAAPFLWDTDFLAFLPAPIAAYFNGQHYSQFPIFPWLGFMLAGSLVAWGYLDASARDTTRLYVRKLFAAAGAMVIGAILLGEMPGPLASTNLQASPLFFFLRLGLVFLLLAACWRYVEFRRTEKSFILDVSRESFLVYVVHLLVIYGQYVGAESIADVYGKSRSPLECFAGSVLLGAVMVALAKGWGWIKQRSFGTARGISYAVAVIALVAFFIRDY